MGNTTSVAAIAVGATSFLFACTGGGGTGSDREVRTAIESAWNGPTVRLLTGSVRFVGNDPGAPIPTMVVPDSTKGEDALSELELYKAFAAKGFITIEDESDLRLLFSGEREKTARVTLTGLGRRSGEVRRVGEVDQLWLKAGKSTIKTIVTNEPLVFGADQYRVVQGTHTFDIPGDIGAALSEERGGRLGRDRRFKALLKFDAFEKRWNFLGSDLGGQDGSFVSDHIDKALMVLRLCGSLNC